MSNLLGKWAQKKNRFWLTFLRIHHSQFLPVPVLLVLHRGSSANRSLWFALSVQIGVQLVTTGPGWLIFDAYCCLPRSRQIIFSLALPLHYWLVSATNPPSCTSWTHSLESGQATTCDLLPKKIIIFCYQMIISHWTWWIHQFDLDNRDESILAN